MVPKHPLAVTGPRRFIKAMTAVTILSKNIMFNFIGQLVAALLGFVAVKFIFQYLGYDILGIIYFCLVLNSVVLGILDKSIYASTVKEVSANFETSKETLTQFLQTFTLMTWLIVFCFSIILLLLTPYLTSNWINLPDNSNIDAQQLMSMLLIASLLAFPTSLYSSILRGLQHMGITNFIDVSFSAIQQIGIILVIAAFEGNATLVITWISAVYFMKMLAYLFVCAAYVPKASLLPRFHSSVFHGNRKFTKDMIYVSMLAMAYKQGDKIALSKFVTIATFGLYSFAFNAISKATIVNSAIGNAAYPVLCKAGARSDRTELCSTFKNLQLLMLYVNVLVFASAIYFCFYLYEWVFDREAAEFLYGPTLLLCCGLYLNCSLALPYRLILALDQTEIAVKQDVLSLLFVLPLVILCTYKFGVLGASTSALFYAAFGIVYIIPKVYPNLLGVSWLSFHKQLGASISKALICFGTPLLILKLTDTATLAYSASAFVVGTLAFIVMSHKNIAQIRSAI